MSVVYGEAAPMPALTPPLSWWIHYPAPPTHCPHCLLPPQYNESLPCPCTCGLCCASFVTEMSKTEVLTSPVGLAKQDNSEGKS
jgi:hypothetical protein